ncbi:MAG TPA: hypothetical protein VGO69_03315 [Pyrinomonadaceae bacterium]|jgi:hypothetical protein|nr:hypothetical protein [Pyrinomonadaceae bacterium]
MSQPTLFDRQSKQSTVTDERLVLYALGNFQARGKDLAERDLPLDRLRGALRRASEAFDIEQLTDERAVAVLAALGAQVQRRHSFAAKHPYHVIVPTELARRARRAYEELTAANEANNREPVEESKRGRKS